MLHHNPGMVRLRTLLCCVFLCLSQHFYAQKPAGGMVRQPLNYTSFSTPAGSGLPYNAPCSECAEDLAARTEYTRTFKGRGAEAGKVYSQSGYSPLHLKDASGQWIPVDGRLKLLQAGVFAAPDQHAPVTIDLSRGSCSVQNAEGLIRFNNRPELLWRDGEGREQSLGRADFSHYSAGDDGVRITGIWPGVDMEIRALLGGLKTNFILNSRPLQTGGELIIRDELILDGGLRLRESGDELKAETASGQEAFNISACIGYDSHSSRDNGVQSFRYERRENILDIVLPLEVLQDPRLVFPYTVDPLVNSSNTLAQGSITGSAYGATCFVNYCSYNLSVPTPANATIIDALWSFNYVAAGSCWLWDGAVTYTTGACASPNQAGYYWFCNSLGTGTCTGSNISFYSDVASCMPAPSCTPQNVPFTMRFYRCYSSGAGCSNACIGAASPWTITLVGQTVEVVSASVNGSGSTTICQGTSATLNASGTFGVPPYTYTWNPGGLNGASVSVSPSSTTVYTLTMTDACSQTASASVTVNVTPQPPVPALTSNSPVCAGQTLNLGTTATGVTYVWSGPNGFSSSTQNPVINNVTAAYSGSYSLYTVSAGCTSAAATVNVTVNPQPATPVAGANAPVCAGQSLNLSGTGSGSAQYTWSGPNGFSSAQQNPVINPATVADSGLYTLYITENGCTSATVTYNAVVYALPATPSVLSNSPVCTGNPIHLSTTAGSGLYAWNGPNGFSSGLQNPVIASATLADAGNYSLVIIQNGCTSQAATVTVNVVTPPVTPAFSTNSPVCAGQTLTLTATSFPLVSYLWSGPNGFSGTGQVVNIPSVTPAEAGTYSLQLAAAGCTSAAVTQTVVVNPVPVTPVAGGNSPLCEGQALNLTATGTGTFVWTGPNGFSSGLQNPSLPAAGIAAAGNYSVYVVENGCTSATAVYTVTVNPSPAAPVLSSNSPVCVGQTIALNTNAVPGAVYSWSGPQGFSSSLQNPSIPSAAASNGGTYSLYVTVNGCAGAVATLQVAVVNPPSAPSVSSNSPVCQGDVLQLTAVTTSNTSYFWTGPAGWNSAVQDPSVPGMNIAMAGNYSCYVVVGGCTSATSVLTVQVAPSPVVSYTGPADVCGASLVLGAQANVSAPATIASVNWYAPALIGSGSSFGYTSGQTPPSVLNGYVVATSTDNCSDTAVFSIQMNDMPVAGFSAEDLCDGAGIQLHGQHSWTGNGGNGPDYLWISGAVTDTGSDPLFGFGGPGTYPVMLVVQNSGTSCADTLNSQVTIHAIPQLSFSTQAECLQEALFYGVVLPDSLISTYTWDFGDGNSTGSGDTVTHAYAQPGNYDVVFSVATTYGCTYSLMQNVEIKKGSQTIPAGIPNIITPNGDGMNDVVDLDLLLGDCGDYEFKVFNRWGSSVYLQRKGSPPFGGKTSGGTVLSPGVYFYVLLYGDSKKEGTITIVQ